MDSTYTNLHANLKKGGRMVIFFDPAHGKLPDGRWQGGEATGRASCTGRPEEYYSIILSRALYGYLTKNPHIEVKSTDDFMEVLTGDSNSYNNIPFSTTVELAKKHNAFLLISEHLNNVSVVYKACGKMNIPGIHIVYGRGGRKSLRYISDFYSGFLTLYNKLDASGFSRKFALNLKERLIDQGLRPNSWELGAVGDSRFTYFVDFPLSVIFESGFISNPHEEKNFRNPQFAVKVAEAQYKSLLDTINEIYGVDISGRHPSFSKEASDRTNELLKLSRIAVYYLRETETAKAVAVIRKMEQLNGRRANPQISYFTNIKNNVLRAENLYATGARHAARRRQRQARRYYRLAWRSLSYNHPIYSAYKQKYAEMLHFRSGSEETPSCGAVRKNRPVHPIAVAKAPLTRPVILTVEKGQSLEDAIDKALGAPAELIPALVAKFSRGEVTERVRVRRYSAKRKRTIRVWATRRRRIRFDPGIYVVTLNKNMNIVGSKRVRSVELDPSRYQNQLYLKNSYFAVNEKRRSL
ncbi:MAG: N-acetylmuramoyl-L-alanine amidase [Spirochaetes bacterium]|nr:N-acetylmuramoyl-L-alanine amidase [Spirochaetota bacterium]